MSKKTLVVVIVALIAVLGLGYTFRWEYREAAIPWQGETIRVSVRTNRWNGKTQRLDPRQGWVPIGRASAPGRDDALDRTVDDILAKRRAEAGQN